MRDAPRDHDDDGDPDPDLVDDARDDAVEPPVVGCRRCGGRVARGSRYCPTCGTPLVRSGEQAAIALSRTRRNASLPLRVLGPLAAGIVLLAVILVATHGEHRGPQGLRERLQRVVGVNRTLTAELRGLRAGADPVVARRAADDAADVVGDVAAQMDADDTPSGSTGRTTRTRRAIRADRTYVRAVVAVLRDPRSLRRQRLADRSAAAARALRAVDDVADTSGAVAGASGLAAYARARTAAGSSSKTDRTAGRRRSASAAARSRDARRKGPFVTAVDAAVAAGRPTGSNARRAVALLRAARDGVAAYPPSAPGGAPPSAAAAIDAAAALLPRVATGRQAAERRARAIDARQANQRSIVEKLAAAYAAGAATARLLDACVGSFRATAPDEIGARCLERSADASAQERLRLAAFRTSYAPARTALGLTPPPTAL